MLKCSLNFSQFYSGVVSALQLTEGMCLVNSYLEVITDCREPAASWAVQGGALPGKSRSVEVILLCSALGRHAWSVWCWAPQNSSGMDIVEKGQHRATNMMEVLEHLSYEEKQQSLDHSAWRREGSGESYPCVLIVMEGDGTRLFSVVLGGNKGH